jgi:3-hydroxymyristoyl/3-hydroxydecanoyl-(acyl carrier protein) dehydratase
MEHIEEAALGPAEKAAPPPGAFLKSAGLLWRRRYRLEADFIAFQGHFPGRPVLPALAQVLFAQNLAARLTGRALAPAAVSQAKFLAPVGPGGLLSVYAGPAENEEGDWRFHLLTAEADGAGAADAAFIKMRFKG